MLCRDGPRTQSPLTSSLHNGTATIEGFRKVYAVHTAQSLTSIIRMETLLAAAANLESYYYASSVPRLALPHTSVCETLLSRSYHQRYDSTPSVVATLTPAQSLG